MGGRMKQAVAVLAVSVVLAVLGPLTAPGAQADPVCSVEDTIFDDQLALRTDVDVRLHVADDQLVVNGTPCGDMSLVPSVWLSGSVEVVIDVSSTWRYDNGETRPTVNIFVDDPSSTITWIGSERGDRVTVHGAEERKITVEFVTRPTGVSELAAVVHGGSRLDMSFDLSNGWDRFRFTSDQDYVGIMTIDGGPGRDWITGGPGRQHINGGDGADRLRGGPGRDVIRGDRGRDRLEGDQGRDQLFGNSGRDVIIGGAGRDRAVGGKGRDTFEMNDVEVDRLKAGVRESCTCDAIDIIE